MRKQLSKDDLFYVELGVFSFLAFLVIIIRCRLGVDLTDETWYSSDPYWVAKGSVPFVNNWTQASGFTLPLFVFHRIYISIVGSNQGIILFSRILYCVWKTIISALSFSILRKAGVKITPILVAPIIILCPSQLFDINYNTIGVTYLLLILAVLFYSDKTDLEYRRKVFVAFIAGMIMGRCVIGTPITLIACIIIFVHLMLEKKWLQIKGFLLGGTIAALAVISFCCVRGGIKNFIIGIQYFIRDLAYFDSATSKKWSLTECAVYIFNYVKPAIVVGIILFILRLLLRRYIEIYNKIAIILVSIVLAVSLYLLLRYSGDAGSLESSARYGWFVTIALLFLKTDGEFRKNIKCLAYIKICYFCVYLLQGYVSNYGYDSRSYWNFISLVLGIYAVGMCAVEVFHILTISKKIFMHCFLTAIGVFMTVLVAKSAYKYVYRDLPVEELTTEVETGIWKGCYTTESRASTVVNIEAAMRSMTTADDEVLCFGNWACFLNLLSNGNLCAANPIGTGQKNGFDFWHMYQKVPNKIFIHVDKEDIQGRMSDLFNIWIFTSKFYEQINEYDYESYDIYGEPAPYRIIEFDIKDYEGALRYADEMATDVFDFQ